MKRLFLSILAGLLAIVAAGIIFSHGDSTAPVPMSEIGTERFLAKMAVMLGIGLILVGIIYAILANISRTKDYTILAAYGILGPVAVAAGHMWSPVATIEKCASDLTIAQVARLAQLDVPPFVPESRSLAHGITGLRCFGSEGGDGAPAASAKSPGTASEDRSSAPIERNATQCFVTGAFGFQEPPENGGAKAKGYTSIVEFTIPDSYNSLPDARRVADALTQSLFEWLPERVISRAQGFQYKRVGSNFGHGHKYFHIESHCACARDFGGDTYFPEFYRKNLTDLRNPIKRVIDNSNVEIVCSESGLRSTELKYARSRAESAQNRWRDQGFDPLSKPWEFRLP